MTSAYEIAFEVLNEFAPNVVARASPCSYGYYANRIGRTSRSDGLAIGQAMHAIGAVCVLRQLPVAPLYWVKSVNGKAKKVFEADPIERSYIIDRNHYDLMVVVAREYRYTEEDFSGVRETLEKILKKGDPSHWTPHHVWHAVLKTKPKNSDVTYFERAILSYEQIFKTLKAQRNASKI